jgi:brefeldin A-inhibited guanine nucleotide-exchange protein
MVFPLNVLTYNMQFSRYLPAVYPIAVDILARDLAPEIREGLRHYFLRVGYVQGIVDPSP